MQIVTVNPATGEAIAAYDASDAGQVEAALAEVHAAQPSWGAAGAAARAERLKAVAGELRSRREDLARLMVTEMGKPVTEALGEIDKCAWVCEYYAGEGPAMLADEAVEASGARNWISYEPLGVVLAIMPWNFPFWQVFRCAAPTLLAGNTLLLKHAPNVTACALAVEEVLRTAGVPAGVFRAIVVAPNDVPARVDALLEDARVAAVTLTGSERAGASVAAAAGRVVKKSLLELGGSDPFVVLDDADLDAAAKGAVAGRFVNSGQSCVAAKRFLVHEAVAEDFLQRFVAGVQRLRVGDPLDPGTQVGPLAREDLVVNLDRQVQASIAAGARVLTGGQRLDRPGSWFAPTVLTGVRTDMPVMAEETFGPVAAVTTFADDAEAVRLANATRYGLSAGVWSGDVDRAVALGKRITSGALFVNAVVASDPRLPFGGTKRSGYGRELGVAGAREFVNVRTWVVGTGSAPPPTAPTE